MNKPVSVIPVKTGIQQLKNTFCLTPLDSRLRGITSDLPACGLSRMASSFTNDGALGGAR